ncbi:monooxygenase [Mycobacterium antarcticum]|nr:monooxygenase [Mycolicibacterium sp. TUM20985]GLP84126.1 monooxygenase [Mycolicibacterium sp. TUM20984]
MVVGAGPAGLAAAAMLAHTGISTVVLERGDAVTESWRHRYDGLRLNTVRWMSSLPGFRMARDLGAWPDRDSWVTYLERYASAHHRIDTDADGWLLRSPGGDRRASTVVVATGHDHTPVIPNWPGRAGFTGELLHSAQFCSAGEFRGRDVLVVGSGNSATEIAHFLVSGGAGRVQLSVRTPPLVLQRKCIGLPLTAFALPGRLLPDRVIDAAGRALARIMHGDLRPFGLPPSPRGLSRMRHTYWSPPMDSGFVADLKNRAIEVVPAVERLDDTYVHLADGRRVRPDALIAATGYHSGLEPLVGHLDVLDDAGQPTARNPRPHLHFAGFRFGLAALLPYIGKDARAIAHTER